MSAKTVLDAWEQVDMRVPEAEASLIPTEEQPLHNELLEEKQRNREDRFTKILATKPQRASAVSSKYDKAKGNKNLGMGVEAFNEAIGETLTDYEYAEMLERLGRRFANFKADFYKKLGNAPDKSRFKTKGEFMSVYEHYDAQHYPAAVEAFKKDTRKKSYAEFKPHLDRLLKALFGE